MSVLSAICQGWRATIDHVESFIVRVLANGVALWVASLILPGITFAGSSSTVTTTITIGAVGLVFGLLNAIVKPVLFVLSLPLLVLTLGLFLLVLNAIMLSLTSWASGALGLNFAVQDFWWDAVLGAVIISIVSAMLSLFDRNPR
ncbi:phage holin family protein [soil metagenome]